VQQLREQSDGLFNHLADARYRMSLIYAVTARGHMRLMNKEKGGVNADVFIEFLKRLLIGAKRKIYLIVERGPANVAKKDEDIRCQSCRGFATVLSAAGLA